MIKGIVFDKDGTLVRFNDYWIDTTIQFVHYFYKKHQPNVPDEDITRLLKSLGISGRQVIEKGPIASGSSKDIAAIISKRFNLAYSLVIRQIRSQYLKQLKRNAKNIESIGDIQALFKKLKDLGYVLGVITSDDYEPTVYTMEAIHALDELGFIGTADHYAQKPSESMAFAFCRQFSFLPEEVIYVGDTEIDMQFARHLAYGIGVLSGVGTQQVLKNSAAYIVPTVHQILNRNDQLIGDV